MSDKEEEELVEVEEQDADCGDSEDGESEGDQDEEDKGMFTWIILEFTGLYCMILRYSFAPCTELVR